jgi:DNA processing protein
MAKQAPLLHNDNDLCYWLALSMAKDIGPVSARRLLAAFHTPKDIFEAAAARLRSIPDIGENKVRGILDFDAWDTVEKELSKADKKEIRLIRLTDREYPHNLRQIEDAPILLYAKGEIIEDDKYAFAMVGSRRMTEYGRRVAEAVSSELASCGLTIVSGMARGIDTVSHQGALKAGGRSIAVLGCGLDRPYPPENFKLFSALCESGCVISEFPLGMPPNKENFPRRNRLISGLSLGTLIVEAAFNSGSLITAAYALEQGKDVFAIPGSVFSKYSDGTNALIKKGARLVQKPYDILEELAPQIKGLLKLRPDRTMEDFRVLPDGLEISAEEKAICNILTDELKHIDVIARELDMPAGKLLSLLLSLEIKGLIRQKEGKNFIRA